MGTLDLPSGRAARAWPLLAALAIVAPLVLRSPLARAAPVTYAIDPDHTHPAFETDHYQGLSVWRGTFKQTKGSVTLDREAKTGSVDIEIDTASVDFGNDALNRIVASSEAPPVLEANKFPTASYRGTLAGFDASGPTTVQGQLTLHGVTLPLNLKILSFKCVPSLPFMKREVCGADATATFNRADFGIRVGEPYGFNMTVLLRIQVEAIRQG